MMKYLKAEAEIIKFDNSDVVTASGFVQVDECNTGTTWDTGYTCFLYSISDRYFEDIGCAALVVTWRSREKMDTLSLDRSFSSGEASEADFRDF